MPLSNTLYELFLDAYQAHVIVEYDGNFFESARVTEILPQPPEGESSGLKSVFEAMAEEAFNNEEHDDGWTYPELR